MSAGNAEQIRHRAELMTLYSVFNVLRHRADVEHGLEVMAPCRDPLRGDAERLGAGMAAQLNHDRAAV